VNAQRELGLGGESFPPVEESRGSRGGRGREDRLIRAVLGWHLHHNRIAVTKHGNFCIGHYTKKLTINHSSGRVAGKPSL
jgi:hypothetical protein